MSVIYLAEQTDVQRKVALKVLNEEYTRNGDCVKRFRQEVTLAASLNHHNILQVYDFGETDNGNLFMAMEHLVGTDLKEVIRMGGVDIAKAVHLSIQIADALGAAHGAGLIHRDLKPGNITVVGREGVVKLMNFGIARLKEAEELTRLTGIGNIFGTPAYMAPEQIEGGDIDARTDIYAFGIVLYEMLTNVVPFRAPTAVAVLMKHVKENPAPLRNLRPDIPAPLAHVVMQALEKKPDRRWQQMAEIVEALRKVGSEASRETAVSALMTTQVLDVIKPQAARLESSEELRLNKTQSAIRGKSYNTTANQDTYAQESISDAAQEKRSYNQTIAVEQTMRETMAMTQPMEAIRNKKQRWKWAGLGGAVIALSFLTVWLTVFWYGQVPDQKGQTILTTGKTEAKKQVASVVIDADKTVLILRERARLRLKIQYAEGATEEPRDKEDVQWASSDPSVLGIGQDGEIDARGIGRAAATARYRGMETPAITIVVTAPSPLSGLAEPRLVSLTIRGGKKEINTKGRLSLRVIGKYSDGRDKEIKGDVQWESSDKSIAAVNPKGEVIGQREGTVDIIARSGDIASKPLNLAVRASVKRQEVQAARSLPSHRIAELNDYIRTAKSYRDRGAYAEALVALQEASKIDPRNKDVQSEIAITRRACNAERTLGRPELKC